MNHNYLIIKVSDEPVQSQFQLKMIVGNDIPGLLNVSKRYIDSDTFLYYEVNSLQTLKSMFEYRKIDKQTMIRLLNGLIKILKEMKNYLLGDDGLLLKAEFIYLNWEKEEIFFVFYPYEKEPAAEQVKELFEYLVRIIDHHDDHLTEKLYDLCQYAEKKILGIEDLERCLAELILSNSVEMDCDKEPDKNFCTQEIVQMDSLISEASALVKEGNLSQTNEKKQRRKFLILTLISAGGAAFTLVYQNFVLLTAREILLSWILLVVFIVFFIMTGAIYILLIYRLRNPIKKAAIEIANHFPGETDYPKLLTCDEPPEYCGDTIFIDADLTENKLYGINRGNKNTINLAYFPFTIGKLTDNTDFCLKESSISRIHVRFTKYDNTVFMTDLNSTNGTFKNGLRLEPSETVPVEAGDEIRLGKLNFSYR